MASSAEQNTQVREIPVLACPAHKNCFRNYIQRNRVLFEFTGVLLLYIEILTDFRVILIVKFYFNAFKTFEIQICTKLNKVHHRKGPV